MSSNFPFYQYVVAAKGNEGNLPNTTAKTNTLKNIIFRERCVWWGQLAPAAKSATARGLGNREVSGRVPVGGRVQDDPPAPVQVWDRDPHS